MFLITDIVRKQLLRNPDVDFDPSSVRGGNDSKNPLDNIIKKQESKGNPSSSSWHQIVGL